MSDPIDVVVETPAPIEVEVLVGGGAQLSTDTPEDLGTAAAGVGIEASRSDHVHAMPSAADVGADPAGAASTVAGDLSTHENLTTSAHGGIVAASDARLTDARTPLAHTHGQSDVTGLVADMAAKQPLDSDLTAIAALSTTAFGRSLLEVVDAVGGRAALSAAAATHVHSGADITSGTVAPARLGTGTADSSKVLRGDGTWSPHVGLWSPVSGVSYRAPAFVANPMAFVATVQGTSWTWWGPTGPFALKSLGVYVGTVGATPATWRFYVHTLSPTGQPGQLLWSSPTTTTASTSNTLYVETLVTPVNIETGAVLGFGIQQLVAGATTAFGHSPNRQGFGGPTMSSHTNNTYGWRTSSVSALGSDPPVLVAQQNADIAFKIEAA